MWAKVRVTKRNPCFSPETCQPTGFHMVKSFPGRGGVQSPRSRTEVRVAIPGTRFAAGYRHEQESCTRPVEGRTDSPGRRRLHPAPRPLRRPCRATENSAASPRRRGWCRGSLPDGYCRAGCRRPAAVGRAIRVRCEASSSAAHAGVARSPDDSGTARRSRDLSRTHQWREPASMSPDDFGGTGWRGVTGRVGRRGLARRRVPDCGERAGDEPRGHE